MLFTKRTALTGLLVCAAAIATTPTTAPAWASSASQVAADGAPSESQWLSDVSPVASSLGNYLDQRLAGARSSDRLAVVLDIDNTSLATHYEPGKPVQAILGATRYAHQHGAAILFASYRDAGSRASTTRQLRSAGYTVDGLCLKPESGHPDKATVKLGCRKQYESQGFTLVANVGNRSTDFQGGHYEQGFKIPDYDGALS
ncbi:acid phosphatase [Streptomyces sp. LP11]|uniref:Acid phosphatase n=1 Tax=Streptomyces pyxinicus TaxID=2970331 RepID=A0ABT2B5G7_9ACTN|nr:HAD family acid phosphatase [Streptomyces sp. LP11]MCS0603601.1 acid phosphatase [Streptomyces sp. LP11]